MKTEYAQDQHARYLVLEEESAYQEDYRYYMLLSNHIHGILPCSLRCMDNSLRFYYEIGTCISLRQKISRSGLTLIDVQTLFLSILELEEECRAYLLQAGNILFLPEYIYTDGNTYRFCYLPIHDLQPEAALHQLAGQLADPQPEPEGAEAEKCLIEPAAAEFLRLLYEETVGDYLLADLMRRMQEVFRAGMEKGIFRQASDAFYSDTREEIPAGEKEDNPFYADGRRRFQTMQDVLYAAQSEKYGPSAEGKAPEEVSDREREYPEMGWLAGRQAKRQKQREKKRMRHEIRLQDREKRRADRDAKRQEKAAQRLQAKEERLREKEARLRKKQELLAGSRRQEEILDMEADPPTTFLYQENMPYRLTLSSTDGTDRMFIDESPYYVGSDDSGYVQGYIPDPVVSKRHAQILQLAGFFFLEDLGSTNSTFHNGHRLDIGERVRIAPGDVVMFANREYHVFASRPVS